MRCLHCFQKAAKPPHWNTLQVHSPPPTPSCTTTAPDLFGKDGVKITMHNKRPRLKLRGYKKYADGNSLFALINIGVLENKDIILKEIFG